MSKNNNSPYWDFVQKHGGQEPFGNNADTLIDPASLPIPEQTQKGLCFTAWLGYGYNRLTTRQKEVFELSFRQELSDNVVAARLGLIVRRIKQIKKRIRDIIAKDVTDIMPRRKK